MSNFYPRPAETLVQGQCEELSPCKQKPYWNSYLRIARLKTGVLFQLPIEGIHLIKSQHLMDSFNYAREWSQLGVIYQIFDDINDFLGLKQQGQKQKDFLEKRLNSIIAYLSQDPMHDPLIQEYLDCEVESSEQKEIIEQLNIIILQEDILSRLKEYCQELLTQFQSSSQTQAKEIILGEMQKTIKKGNLHHENASL